MQVAQHPGYMHTVWAQHDSEPSIRRTAAVGCSTIGQTILVSALLIY